MRNRQYGNFVLITFIDVFSEGTWKFHIFWFFFRNYFVYFFTHRKDTDGGLVPFNFSLNSVSGNEKPPTWEFCFNHIYWRFFGRHMKISYFLIFFRNCFVNFFTHRKDTDEGWYHSFCHWIQYLGMRNPQYGNFVLITFIDVFSEGTWKFHIFWFFSKLFCLFLYTQKRYRWGVDTIRFVIEFSIWEWETPNMGILF